MEDLLIIIIFLSIMFIPYTITMWISEHKQNKKPAVIRKKYDTVYNWFLQQYALEYKEGLNVPPFMNHELIKKAMQKQYI